MSPVGLFGEFDINLKLTKRYNSLAATKVSYVGIIAVVAQRIKDFI
jgi:hypothetical protein